MDLRSFLSSIDWSKVKKISVSKKGSMHSFSIKAGKKKHIISVGIGPNATTLTVTEPDGRILWHVVQHGKEMIYYEPKPSQPLKLQDPTEALIPVHFAQASAESDFNEKGI